MKKITFFTLAIPVAKRQIILFFALALLVSCSVTSKTPGATTLSSPSVTSPLRISKATMTVTASPSPTTTLTSTPLIPSATPTISPTPTFSVSVMRYQCLDIADSLAPDQAPEGILVFKNEDNTDAFLWNMKTGTQVRFPREEGDLLLGFDVSPDRTRVVYRHSSDVDDRAVIATSDGKSIWSEAISGYSWFDNNRLQGSAVDSIGGFLYLILLNPLTGESQELQPDFPNLYLDLQYPKWHVRGFAVYDPTLTRAVYPECDADCNKRWNRGELGWTVTLWDIEEGKSLAKLLTMDIFGGTPIWSPDGKQFFIATNDLYNPASRFYSVSRDGQISQLAYFPDMWILNSYSLSPDGRLIAFWIAAESEMWDEARLAVLDTTAGDITNYCITNATPGYLVQPIWSPDGAQLLLDVPDPDVMTLNHGSQRNALLVDLVQGWAARIAENMTPVGWMVSP